MSYCLLGMGGLDRGERDSLNKPLWALYGWVDGWVGGWVGG